MPVKCFVVRPSIVMLAACSWFVPKNAKQVSFVNIEKVKDVKYMTKEQFVSVTSTGGRPTSGLQIRVYLWKEALSLHKMLYSLHMLNRTKFNAL